MAEGEGNLVEGMGGCVRWYSWFCTHFALQTESVVVVAPKKQSLRGVRQSSLLFPGDQWTCFWDLIRKVFDSSCRGTEHKAAIKQRRFHSPDARESPSRVMRLELVNIVRFIRTYLCLCCSKSPQTLVHAAEG